MGQPWGRLYTGTRNHRKITAIRRKHKDTWTYIYVLMECSFESDDEGKIYVSPTLPYSIEELADEIHFHKSPKFLQDLIETAVKVGLFSYENQVPQWLSYSERQFKSDTNVGERVRKHRENQKNASEKQSNCNVTETLPGNKPVTDQIQNRADTEQNKPPSPPKGGTTPFQKIIDLWNTHAPELLPRASLTEKRKPAIKAAWKDHPDLEWWKVLFIDIELSPWHSHRDKWTGCSFDWILKKRTEMREKLNALKGNGNARTPPIYTPPEEPGELLTFDRNCPLCRGHPGAMLNPPGSEHKYDPCTCLHPVNEVKNGSPQATASTQ